MFLATGVFSLLLATRYNNDHSHRDRDIASQVTPVGVSAAMSKSSVEKKSNPKKIGLSDKSKAYFESQKNTNEVVKSIYEVSVKILREVQKPNVIEFLSIYFAVATVRNSDPDFSDFYGDLMSNLVTNSSDVFEVLKLNNDTLYESPFIYQNALNLAARLDIPKDAKTAYIGQALILSPFSINAKNEISPASASMTVALILMKSIQSDTLQVARIAQKGLSITQASGSSPASQALSLRVRTFFPEISL
jgi:hypothetical protein